MNLAERLRNYEGLPIETKIEEYEDSDDEELDMNIVLLSLTPMLSKALGKLGATILTSNDIDSKAGL